MEKPALTGQGRWWLDAAQEFGLEVEAPYAVAIPGYGTVWADAYLKNFSHLGGILLMSTLPPDLSDEVFSAHLAGRHLGVSFSGLQHGEYAPYRPGAALPLLLDFEWSGHPRKRPALLGEKLATRAHRSAKQHGAKVGDRVQLREPLDDYGFLQLGAIGIIDRIVTSPWPAYDVIWEGRFAGSPGAQVNPSAVRMLGRPTHAAEQISSLGTWWLAAQHQLGFAATIPYPLSLPNVGTVWAQAHLEDFGSPKGILFMHSLAGRALDKPLRQYLASIQVPVRFSGSYADTPYKDAEPLGILRDCGWHGAPDRRPAWLGDDSSTRARRAAKEQHAEVGDRVQVIQDTPYNTRIRSGAVGTIEYIYSTPWPHYNVALSDSAGDYRAEVNPADVQVLPRR